MASSSSSSGSNSSKNDSTSSISESSNTNNAPPPSPEMVHFPSSLPFPVFPIPPQVFLPHEVQLWEGSEEDEVEDSKLLLMVEEDAEDKAYDAFMGASFMCKGRRRVLQEGFGELESSDDYSSGDGEGEEEEEEGDEKDEEDMALDYP